MKNYHICFNIDDNYLKYAAVTIHSIISATKSSADISSTPFIFHIITEKLSIKSQEMIFKFVREENELYPCSLYMHQVSVKDFSVFKPWGEGNNFAACLRLIIPQILNDDIEKVLYIDADIICLQDLRPLFDIDLEHKVLGAVPDIFIPESMQEFMSSNNNNKLYWKRLNYGADEMYFNSGLLLIDLKLWREGRFTARCLSALQEYDVNYPDQDALNIALRGQVKLLPIYWNYQSLYSLPTKEHLLAKDFNLKNKNADLLALIEPYIGAEQLSDIKVLHYTARPKPWENISNINNIFYSPLWLYPWYFHAASVPVFNAEFVKFKHYRFSVYDVMLWKFQHLYGAEIEHIKSSAAKQKVHTKKLFKYSIFIQICCFILLILLFIEKL